MRNAECGIASPRIVVILGAGALLGLLAGARLAMRPLAPIVMPDAAAGVDAPAAATTASASDSLVRRFVARDPFRLTRRPADVAYDPLRLAEQLAPPAPKPVLALSGIVWASGSGAAVVLGLPGVDGPRVVRVGDQVAGIRVRKIGRDAVWLVGMDTTWVLTLKEVK